MENKVSTFNCGMIWFGAAVSIAEIMTGTLLAPLGFKMGMLASFIGHGIGCCLMFFAGIIGGKTECNSMETTAFAFGKKGAVFFSLLNIIQLVGWTAVMINSGASGISVLANNFNFADFFLENKIWVVIITLLISLWIIIGIKNLGKINLVAVGSLFVLTIIMSVIIFSKNKIDTVADEVVTLSFGQGIELAIAMPLSWLPLIADYTKNAKSPVRATSVSCVSYFFGSMWMYAIGLGASLFTGKTDVAQIMFESGLGIVALIILIFSTVTTTFLDVFSAGESFLTITKKINPKIISLAVCIIGMMLAAFAPMEKYESFLYFISSVFAPMIAILITDYFILKNKIGKRKLSYICNIVAWILGFALYRIFMKIDTPLGNTTPVMLLVGCITIILNKFANIRLKE